MNKRHIYLFAVFCITVSPYAFADIVWPALYLETRLVAWWVVALGLFVEFLFIRYIFSLPVARAALVDVTANGISALLGVPTALKVRSVSRTAFSV